MIMTKEEKEYKERRQWFLDRIGKRVYRESNGCPCDTCKNITKEGLEIYDESHALYLHDCEGMSGESEHPFRVV